MFDDHQFDERGLRGLELRASEVSGSMPTIVGYAAVYDRWSEELYSSHGPFREKIAPGAFRKVLLGTPDVRAVREHDPGKVLGRTPKTLRLKSDKKGLRVEIDPPDTEIGRETVTLVRRGDLDGMSFKFGVLPDGAEWNDDGSERTVTEVAQLVDVAIVSFPAYKDTVASVTRSQSDQRHHDALTMKLERIAQRARRIGERLKAI